MRVGQVAVRYAKALFQSSMEQKVLDAVHGDMEILLEAITQVPEISQLLESPIVDSRKKASILTEIFKPNMSPLGLDFLNLVAANKREEYFPGMAHYFIELYKKEKGIKIATISSADGLDKDSADQIKQMVKTAFKSEIELKEEIKEDLIGGFVLRVENKQLDASVKGELARIKKELQN